MRFFILLLVINILIPLSHSRSTEEIKISEDREILIGIVDDIKEPFIYNNASGKKIGIDIDLSNRIAKELGVNPRFILLKNLDERIEFLVSKKIDIVVSLFTIRNTGKRKNISFSDPYYSTGIGVLLGSDYKERIREFKDLKSHNITLSAINGSTAYKQLESLIREEQDDSFSNIKLKGYDSQQNAINDIASGKIQGYCNDRVLLLPYQQKYPEKYYVLKNTIRPDDYGIGINKEDINLKKEINLILSKLKENGFLDKIKIKHLKIKKQNRNFFIHIVKHGDNLSDLALKYHKEINRHKEICNDNKSIVKICSMLPIGAKLKIRGKEYSNEIENNKKRCKASDFKSSIRKSYLEELFNNGKVSEKNYKEEKNYLDN